MKVATSSFEWDRHNVEKLEAHNLEPDAVEFVFALDEPIFRRHRRISGRFVALGFAPDGRFVLAVFTYNRKRRSVRVVTAYQPTDPSWRRRYETIQAT